MGEPFVHALICFNPRPVISHGAIQVGEPFVHALICFNPRPVISHGAIKGVYSTSNSGLVSIRAP